LTQELVVEAQKKSWHVCRATWQDWLVQVCIVTGIIMARCRRNTWHDSDG